MKSKLVNAKVTEAPAIKWMHAKAMNETRFIPYIIEAMQEQQKIIDDLKQKNEEQNARIEKLEKTQK